MKNMNPHDEQMSLPSRPVEQLNFQSLSEYACAKMLEKYAGWKGFEGATFQILVGRAIYDFRINDTFVEYHPISVHREFGTDALRDIRTAIRNLPRQNKLLLMESLAEELKAQYSKRRGQTLAAHPVYSRMELLCVHSVEEFVGKVLRRFAVREVPDIAVAAQEFRRLQKAGKRMGIN